MTTFFQHIEGLNPRERKEFRKQIIKICSIEAPTWYSWLRRKKVSKQSQKLIANAMNSEPEILFPE